jgi:hypothetical protein
VVLLGTINKQREKQMPKYNINDKVIDTTKFIKGTGTITDVMSTSSTGSIRYHVDFKDTNESGWFREEELKVKENL